MFSLVLSIPTHFPPGVYIQALVASETCGSVAWFVGLIGISVSMRLAFVLASFTWVIWLISHIHTLHFPVGWISSSALVGCISKTAFGLIVSPCVVFQVFKGSGWSLKPWRSRLSQLVSFGDCTWDSYSETLLARLFRSFNSSTGSQVGAQVTSINSCSEKLFLFFLSFFG